MWMNEIKQKQKKLKSRHILTDHAFYWSILPTNNAVVSLKDHFTVRRQSQKEDFLPIIYY